MPSKAENSLCSLPQLEAFTTFCRDGRVHFVGLCNDNTGAYLKAVANEYSTNGRFRFEVERVARLYLDEEIATKLFKKGKLFNNYGLTIFTANLERFLKWEVTLSTSYGGPGFYIEAT